MTGEELEKKAVEYRIELVPYTELGYPDVEIPVYSALQINEAYIAGAKTMQEETLKEIIEIEKVSDCGFEENEQLKAQIEKMKKYCDCQFCKHCDDELTNPETGKTICEICIDNNLWELAE